MPSDSNAPNRPRQHAVGPERFAAEHQFGFEDVRLEEGPDGPVIAWAASTVGPEHLSQEVGLLRAFMRLADGSPEDILAFATKYGPLGLPEFYVTGAILEERPGRIPVIQGYPLTGREPVTAWRKWARCVRAIFVVASALRNGQPGRVEDWEEFHRAQWFDDPRGPALAAIALAHMPESLAGRRQVIVPLVNAMLHRAHVMPELTWYRNDPRIVLRGVGAHGAVARQLAFSIAGSRGWVVCHGCGVPFIPDRRPARGQRSWCSHASCKRAARAQAKRDQRERDRRSTGPASARRKRP